MFARRDESADEGDVTAVTLFAARIRWVSRALGRSPLVRLVDRVEALAVLGVVIAALAVIPAAMSAGTMAYDAGVKTAEAEASTRHSVDALVIEGVGLPTDFDTPSYVRVRWTEGAKTRTEQVVGTATTKAGDRMKVWLDDNGKVVAAPSNTTDAQINAVAVATTLWISVVAAGALAAFGVRRGLDRMRHRAWDRELLLLAHNDDGWANRYN
jgi:hypothetical protein